MVRLTGGDEAALSALFERHGPAVFGLARRVVGDEQLAEEVLEDAFIRVARESASYRSSPAGALPWLLRIARNGAIDVLRKRKRQRVTADPELLPLLADEREGPELEGADLEEFSAAVRAALAELPEGPRKALDLAYFSGLTQSEIAARLSVPLGTAKTWVRSGLQALRGRLGRFFSPGRAA